MDSGRFSPNGARILSIAGKTVCGDDLDMTEQPHEELGRAITAALKAAKVSKTRLAKETGRTWPTVHAWCTGKHRPGDSDLAAVARLTGVAVDSLLGGPEPSESPLAGTWEAFTRTPEYRMLQAQDAELDRPWLERAVRVTAENILAEGKGVTLTVLRQMAVVYMSIDGEQG